MRGPRGTRQQRGYGVRHQRLREHWAPLVASGRVTCWRCGEKIPPRAEWHLGHDDHDRTKYRGPEHSACNLGAPRQRVATPSPPPGARPTEPAPTEPPDDIDSRALVGSWQWSVYDQRWMTAEELAHTCIPFEWKAWGLTSKPEWLHDRRPGVRDAR